MPCVVFILGFIAEFAYYVIYRFLFLCITYACYSVRSYLYSLRYNWSLWRLELLVEEIQFFSGCFPFLLFNLTNLSLEISMQLFPSYFCFIVFAIIYVCTYNANAIIGCVNETFFSFFKVDLVSLFWWIYAALNASICTNCQCHILWKVINIFICGPFVWFPPLSILRMVPSVLQGELPRCIFQWCDFCCRA